MNLRLVIENFQKVINQLDTPVMVELIDYSSMAY